MSSKAGLLLLLALLLVISGCRNEAQNSPRELADSALQRQNSEEAERGAILLAQPDSASPLLPAGPLLAKPDSGTGNASKIPNTVDDTVKLDLTRMTDSLRTLLERNLDKK